MASQWLGHSHYRYRGRFEAVIFFWFPDRSGREEISMGINRETEAHRDEARNITPYILNHH